MTSYSKSYINHTGTLWLNWTFCVGIFVCPQTIPSVVNIQAQISTEPILEPDGE